MPDKLHVDMPDAPPPDPAALKDVIAQRVRADSRERRQVTPEETILALCAEFPPDAIRDVLSVMGAEASYADIKAAVAASGRVYLFSVAHLPAAEAQERGRLEEAKSLVAEQVRDDSQALALTPFSALEPLLPTKDAQEQEKLFAEMQGDERFRDIGRLEGPKGEAWFHSDNFLTGAYARILLRAKALDAAHAIAELVRDRSRTIPRPTSISTFRDRAFGIDPARLDEVVAQALSQNDDIRKVVHPETGGAWLYSERFLSAQQAASMVDWDEVGAARNP